MDTQNSQEPVVGPVNTSAAPPLQECPPVAAQATKGAGNITGTDTTAEWTIISDAMKEHDEQTVADWKDDLNNLLVFTGLFSAVVTGFAVESYSWLQTTPPDSSIQIQLLAQISSQLASFSVAQGFVNSTTQPIPLIEIEPPAETSKLNVQINTLWFLSLGISLIASLLSIMVQQWLREYRLPGHLAIRERIRLRQYRYQGLLDWGVPEIVSVLPVLLQVALILFLAGLCQLLASLDETVAKAFIIFVGISLSVYFAFTVLPIAFRRCPYKNPIAQTLTGLVKSIIMIWWIFFGLSAMVAMFAFVKFLQANSRRLRVDIEEKVTNLHLVVTRTVTKVFVKVNDARYGLSGAQYWTSRELAVLPQEKNLDRDALIWAPSAVSKSNLQRLDRCLEDLNPKQRLRTVINWTAQALYIDETLMDDAVSDVNTPFDLVTLAKIDSAFAERFRASLLQVLPDKLTEWSWMFAFSRFYEPAVLVMLRHIVLTKAVDADFVTPYTQRIMSIRSHQSNAELLQLRSYTRLVTPCLFEISTVLLYDFSDDEVSQLFDHALQIQDTLYPIGAGAVIFVPCLEFILVSAATAMHAVSRRPSILHQNAEIRDKCRTMLRTLDEIVVVEKVRINYLGSYPADWIGDGVLLASVPATASLCHSVVSLVEAEAVPVPALATLVTHMIDTFQGQPAFAEGVAVLVQFRDLRLVSPVALPPVEETSTEVTQLADTHEAEEKDGEKSDHEDHEIGLGEPPTVSTPVTVDPLSALPVLVSNPAILDPESVPHEAEG